MKSQVLEVCRRIQWCQQVEDALDAVFSTLSRPDLSTVAADIGRELQAVTEAVRDGSESDDTQNDQHGEVEGYDGSVESEQDNRENKQQCKGSMWGTRQGQKGSDKSKGSDALLMRKKSAWQGKKKKKEEKDIKERKVDDNAGSQHNAKRNKYLRAESLSCLMTTLLELRDTTDALHSDSPSSRSVCIRYCKILLKLKQYTPVVC